MSLRIVQTTLTSALAASGTFAIGYPAGTTPGHFTGGLKHKLATGSGNVFDAPKYFTLTFGASSITVNWGSGSPTLPAGTVVYVQLDQAGYKSDAVQNAIDPPLANSFHVADKLLSLGSPITADADGLSVSQTVTGAGTAALLNGALVVSGVGVLDGAAGRNVVGAWTNTAVITITGKDVYGNTIVEQSASGTSHTGKKAFAKVTSITTSATITSATFGTGNKLGLPVFVPNVAAISAELQDGINISPPSRVYVPWELEQTQLLAPTAEQIYSPVAGYIHRNSSIVQAAVTTGGAITTEVNTVAVVGLSLTIADAAAAGSVVTDTPTTPRSATTVVARGDAITITPAAAFATAGEVNGMLEIEASPVQGTFVAGVISAAQSATTDDVRGMYTPSTVPDGTTSYQLMVRLADPDFLGVSQYAG